MIVRRADLFHERIARLESGQTFVKPQQIFTESIHLTLHVFHLRSNLAGILNHPQIESRKLVIQFDSFQVQCGKPGRITQSLPRFQKKFCKPEPFFSVAQSNLCRSIG